MQGIDDFHDMSEADLLRAQPPSLDASVLRQIAAGHPVEYPEAVVLLRVARWLESEDIG